MLTDPLIMIGSRWFALAISAWLLGSVSAEVLIPASSSWKYFKGHSEASSPDLSAWRIIGFNDSSWTTGNAPFFYGEAIVGGTLLNDMQGNYSSVFLRRTFSLANLSQVAALDLDVRADDGFVAWLNGTQIASKAPPVSITFDALAAANSPEPAVFETFSIPLVAARSGDNVLAVQFFNVSLAGSSDVLLDAQLISKERETISPTITRATPLPGSVTNLTQISVTFSEQVAGVNASDLRLNDIAATAVVGAGADYTFSFPQPPFGPVQVTWSIDANITDTAVPPNPFDRSAPGATFFYELVDPTMPMIATVHPPQESIVRNLSEVEILFNKVVTGVDVGDLRLNGQPATNIVGLGAGPYRFYFPAQQNGTVAVTWAQGHGIKDIGERENPFTAIPWNYTVNSAQPLPRVRINEVMAANENGLLDQDGSAEDWIELYNDENVAVSLEGWSLTDDSTKPNQWVFPRVTIGPKQYLIVFASGKDIRDPGAVRLHTNFKLSLTGEYLGLLNADSPRRAVSEFLPTYPETRNDYSYGLDGSGAWRYFRSGTPGATNGNSTIAEVVEPVHFSVERGFFNLPFQLSLHSPTPGAVIRYTFDGREPTETIGTNYTAPLLIDRTRMVRVAAFKPNALPSVTRTHSYFFNIPANRMRLPTLSLVTSSNHLFGTTGIMEVNPRNTTKHGMAWERPISVELIRPEDNSGFQIDCGIRIQGGGYIRERYNYRTSTLPEGKYSFRLYFRGDYGVGKLNYKLFPEIPLESFDEVVLRSGMNDHSNPFIRDEMTRLLSADLGIVASHGTFMHLFLNGVYEGLYNPTERISPKFLQAWHGGTEDWDVIAQSGEIAEGDAIAWNQLRSMVSSQNPATPSVMQQIEERLDIDNFIDYLLVNVYAGTDDWPYNNWRSARERVPGSKFRFYVWDAEWSFGYNNTPTVNSFGNQLAGTSEIPTIYKRLRLSPEFRLRFADRAHKHFYNKGALTDERIRARYESIRSQVASTISGFDNSMSTSWIAQRRRYVTNHIASAGLLASSNAPIFNLLSGRVAQNIPITMSAGVGDIWFTTNGVDPRIPFTGAVSPTAVRYIGPVQISASTSFKARTQWSTNWSALSEGVFQLEQLGIPIRIAELMYNPPGGDAYEFIELVNVGPNSVDISGFTFEGVTFRFAQGSVIASGARLVLCSSLDPAAFTLRYPNTPVFGTYTGALNNGGERIVLRDAFENIVTIVEYDDENGWPQSADGPGYSIELIDSNADAGAVSSWRASAQVGGSPGARNSTFGSPSVRLNEIFASGNATNAFGTSDWIELANPGLATVDISGWSLSDDSDPRRFIFPNGTSIPAGGFLSVWCDTATNQPGLHTGFGLNAQQETVFLFDASTNRVDAITYGVQLPSHSIGRSGMDGLWTLTLPTQGASNEEVAVSASVVINEVYPNPIQGSDDWLELHNANTNLPAGIGGYYLSISNNFSRLPQLSFIRPGGFIQIFADENYGSDHIAFKLPATGAILVLSDDSGEELNRFTYGNMREGVSFGRFPDGTGGIIDFPASASPGAANYLPTFSGVQLNEVLAASRTTDWIELYNAQATPVDLSGFSLSVGDREPGEWNFPAGTTLPAGGYLRVDCDPSRAITTNSAPVLNMGRGLNDNSAAVYLFDRFGQLLDFVEFGAQIPDLPIGRLPSGWFLLTGPTPVAQNAPAALLGNRDLVRINEWMADPLAGDDWIELYNPEPNPVDIGGFFITDDPSISGRTNSPISPLTFIGANGFILLQADNERDKGADHVAFSLDAFGETLRLFNNAVMVDQIALLVQTPGVSEGRYPDGSTNVVQFPGLATPAAPNSGSGADIDGDGMPDAWEQSFGLRPSDPSDALLDADGDGMSNLGEFRVGTDPTSATSVLSLEVETDQTGVTILKFRAAPNKSYSILAVDSISSLNWERVGSISPGVSREVELVDDDVSDATRFYRIVSPMQP